jgi:cytochrome c biogenesis factor
VLLIGELSLWIALLMAAWGATVSFAGGALRRRDLAASGRRALYVAAGALALAVAGVVDGLVHRDFTLAYVALHTSLALSTPYAVAALWSGPAGTMLLWALVLALAAALMAPAGAARDRTRGPWVAGVSALFLLFVLCVVALQANPYERLSWRAADGQGLDPRLQVSAMVLQRPLLVMGYVAACLPAVLVLGGLLARRLDADAWAGARRWAVAAWAALGGAILLAARGALATGGAWAWPPDVAVPAAEWACVGLLLHTMARGRRGGILAKANVPLVVASALGALAGGYGLVAAGADAMFEPGRNVTVAPWIGGAVALVAAAAYLAATRGAAAARSDDGPVGDYRRPGALAAHAASVVLALGLAGSLFVTRHTVSLRTGQDARLADPFGGVWRFVGQGVSRFGTDDHDAYAATLEAARDGAPRGLVVAERLQYRDAQGDSVFAPVLHAGVRTTPLLQLRTELLATDGDTARLRITFVPLAPWIWVGGIALVLSGVVAVWPRARREHAA